MLEKIVSGAQTGATKSTERGALTPEAPGIVRDMTTTLYPEYRREFIQEIESLGVDGGVTLRAPDLNGRFPGKCGFVLCDQESDSVVSRILRFGYKQNNEFVVRFDGSSLDVIGDWPQFVETELRVLSGFCTAENMRRLVDILKRFTDRYMKENADV